MTKYDRRELFRTFGASALFLHPLLSLRDAQAQDMMKRRLMYFHTSSGVVGKNWWPKHQGKTFDLKGSNLEGLKDYVGDLTFVHGTRNFHNQALDSHSSGMVNLMTGQPVSQDNCSGSCDMPPGDRYARSISVDQLIADRLKDQTAVRSLSFACVPTRIRPSGFLSYKADGTYVPQITNPYLAFDQMFKDLVTNCSANSSPDAAKLAAIRAKKKSILDAITADLKDATRISGLSASEKAKLETYTQTVRELEASLNTMVSDNNAVCGTLNGFLNEGKIAVNASNYPKIARLMMDLIVAAFQLDLSRVASLVWSVGGSDGVPSTFANHNGQAIQTSYHALTHQPRGDAEELVSVLDKFHASEFAYLLQRLKAAQENGSSLLDKSMVIWQSELADGFSHSARNIPLLIAGKAGGNIKGGQFIDVAVGNDHKVPTQAFNLSTIHAMGFPDVKSFGSSQWTEGNSITSPIGLK